MIHILERVLLLYLGSQSLTTTFFPAPLLVLALAHICGNLLLGWDISIGRDVSIVTPYFAGANAKSQSGSAHSEKGLSSVLQKQKDWCRGSPFSTFQRLWGSPHHYLLSLLGQQVPVLGKQGEGVSWGVPSAGLLMVEPLFFSCLVVLNPSLKILTRVLHTPRFLPSHLLCSLSLLAPTVYFLC